MNEPRLHSILRRVVQDLKECGFDFALVGGLAVSTRAEPRFTRDVDLSVAVAGDVEAESLARSLRGRGYSIVAIAEQEAVRRLATLRLLPPGERSGGVIVDLLFASCGIEREVVKASEPIEVIPGLTIQVALGSHLLAMKILSRDDVKRPQDLADIRLLLKAAKDKDLEATQAALQLIHMRGFNRDKDLLRELKALTE